MIFPREESSGEINKKFLKDLAVLAAGFFFVQRKIIRPCSDKKGITFFSRFKHKLNRFC